MALIRVIQDTPSIAEGCRRVGIYLYVLPLDGKEPRGRVTIWDGCCAAPAAVY